MARVHVKPTGVGRKHGQPKCGRCEREILPGEQRYQWSFRYGGSHCRCMECGAPRPSETTQSRIGELYAARESIEDVMSASPATVEDLESALSDLESALEDARGIAEELAGDYEIAAEPFGGAGENMDRSEACQQWAEELSGVSLPGATVEEAEAPLIEAGVEVRSTSDHARIGTVAWIDESGIVGVAWDDGEAVEKLNEIEALREEDAVASAVEAVWEEAKDEAQGALDALEL